MNWVSWVFGVRSFARLYFRSVVDFRERPVVLDVNVLASVAMVGEAIVEAVLSWGSGCG